LAAAVQLKLVVPALEIIRVVDALALSGEAAVVTARAGSKIAALVKAARIRDRNRSCMGTESPPHSLLTATRRSVSPARR
jgi:hypothetical protein